MARTVTLERIELQNVRCHEGLTVPIGRGFTFVVGANGTGKTSVLEAITLVFRGASPRAGSLGEVLRRASDVMRVEGHLLRGQERITAGFAYSASSAERRSTANGGVLPGPERWIELVGVRTFFPDDLDLVKGGPQVRRRFLDQVLAPRSTEYRRALRTYEEALRQRNVLLRRGIVGGDHAPWEEILGQSGPIITRRRSEILGEMAPWATHCFAALTGREDRQLSLVYRTNTSELDPPAYRERLRSLRAADRRRTFTQIGPHRDDIRVLMDGMDLRESGSQGEQRTSVLALILGEHRWAEEVDFVEDEAGRASLLLLDDVMSELDSERRRRVLTLLRGRGQVVVTATEEDQLAAPPVEEDEIVDLGSSVKNGASHA